MIIVIFAFFILIILGLLESIIHARRCAGIGIRILVNGTRGKTSVTRMLTSALQEKGMKVLAKTTGSEAAMILPDGIVVPVNRKHGVNVLRENITFFKRAYELKVDAVVLECMAVRPENQVLMARVVKPTISIITNARIDHIDVMGNTVKSTASVLKLSVPNNKEFYTQDFCYSDDPNAIIIGQGKSVKEKNTLLCLSVLSKLGVSKDVALRGIDKYVPDIGLQGPFDINGHHIINGFAVNDKQSAFELMSSIKCIKDATIIYNNRSDREFRLLFFAEVFSDLKVSKIIVIGEHLSKCVRYFSKNINNCNVSAFYGTCDTLLSLCNNIIVCTGNIKGKGIEFIEYCQEKSK